MHTTRALAFISLPDRPAGLRPLPGLYSAFHRGRRRRRAPGTGPGRAPTAPAAPGPPALPGQPSAAPPYPLVARSRIYHFEDALRRRSAAQGAQEAWGTRAG